MQWGGWFRKEIKTRRPEGPQDAHRRLGGHVVARVGVVPSRSRAGDIIQRSSVARSTRSSGSAPTTTRSSASTRSRSTTIRPAGRRAGRCSTRLPTGEMERPAGRVQEGRRGRGTGDHNHDDGALRPKNPEALLRLIAGGATVSLFPPEVIETIYAAAQEHYAGLIASNETFSKIYNPKGVQGPELPLPPGRRLPIRCDDAPPAAQIVGGAFPSAGRSAHRRDAPGQRDGRRGTMPRTSIPSAISYVAAIDACATGIPTR